MEYKFDHDYFILLPGHPKLFSIVAKSIILFLFGPFIVYGTIFNVFLGQNLI